EPLALNGYAFMLLQRGKVLEAAGPANKAARLAPYDPTVLTVFAAVEAALGRCTEAADAQGRALELLPEQVPPGIRPFLENKLAEYQEYCSAVEIPLAGAAGTNSATATAPVASPRSSPTPPTRGSTGDAVHPSAKRSSLEAPPR